MKNDAPLLHYHAFRRSETHFAEFVRRHVDFVCGFALREPPNADPHVRWGKRMRRRGAGYRGSN